MNQTVFRIGSISAHLGGAVPAAQAERPADAKKLGAALVLTIKMVSQTIGLWAALG